MDVITEFAVALLLSSSAPLGTSTRWGQGSPASAPRGPSPHWPWRLSPQAHTEAPSSVRMREWPPPAAAQRTRTPRSASTRCRGPTSWKWPCPSWPCRPRPQLQRPPHSPTASVWFDPAATDATRTFSPVTGRGTSTSIGVQPPCPSSPLLARPQVRRVPERLMAAQWLPPHETDTIWLCSFSSLLPLELAFAPEAGRLSPSGAGSSGMLTGTGVFEFSYPRRPSCPWNPRPKEYSAMEPSASPECKTAALWYAPKDKNVACFAAASDFITKWRTANQLSPGFGLRKHPYRESRNKDSATRSTIPEMLK
mmetsp:Transcript_36299/g.79200  ORF Transcript_36299/g.79200 Transcript_36299/m.79200 type:complete len:309 (-) Transcript_36299:397-1323(-)